MGNGLNYVLRLLKGENPQSVIESMPEEDFNKVMSVAGNLKGNVNLNRQQRRKLERKLKGTRK